MDAHPGGEYSDETTQQQVHVGVEALREYVLMLVPTVYSVDVPLSMRIRLEIFRSHKFFSIFASVQSERDRRDQILNSFHILTLATVLISLVIVAYDIAVSYF